MQASLNETKISSKAGKECLRETLNATRLLTRLSPLIYEDTEWIGFFHSKVPNENGEGTQTETLAEKLITVSKRDTNCVIVITPLRVVLDLSFCYFFKFR